MKNAVVAIILLVAMAIGCSSNTEGLPKEPTKETPKVLKGGEVRMDFSESYGSRGGYDLVGKLYEEAMENDPDLKQFDKRMNALLEQTYDSLEPFHKYEGLNNEYWASCNRLASGIQDTVLRKSMTDFIGTLQSKHAAELSQHYKKLGEVHVKQQHLRDQLVIHKLLVSYPLMANYQRNERPALETFDNLITKYDKANVEASKRATIPK